MKREVAERKAAMIEERRREENARVAAGAAAEMAAAQAKEPFIVLAPIGSYFNGPWFSRWTRGCQVPPNFTLPAHTLPGIPGDFHLFTDLEDRLDLGQGSITLMGALETFVIRDYADVKGWDRQALGLPAWPDKPLHLQNKTKDHGLADLFDKFRGQGTYAPVERLSNWTGWFPRKWCQIGNPQSLKDTLPIEVIYSHRGDVIIAVRSLKDAVAPAEAAAEGAGGADQQAPDAVPAHAVTTAAPPKMSKSAPTPEEVDRATAHERRRRQAARTAADAPEAGGDLEQV